MDGRSNPAFAKIMPNQIRKQSSADTNGPPQEAAMIAETANFVGSHLLQWVSFRRPLTCLC